jgi:uncharacterized protein YjbI with pentapeptide repeats
LIATIWIPIVLAIYTLVENKSNESIAVNNRLKDLEIANISRTSELEIAEANRLNELDIAEKGRQKDRDLATDQQRQNILIEYESFLAKLILENGVTLSTNPRAKQVALFMTRAVLNQLDTVRRSILFRSLYDTSMIILKSKVPGQTSPIDLRQFDLSGIRFSLLTDFPEKPNKLFNAEWYYLWIPGTILKNASFRYTELACADFTRSILDLADLSFASGCISPRCFDNTDMEASFFQASLVNTSWYKAHFCFTTFAFANLTFADMRELTCSTCDFSTAILFKADLSKSKIYHYDPLNKGRLPFYNAILRQAVLRGANYRFINFDGSDWSDSQASAMIIVNCTFTQARMENCSLSKSNIYNSFFRSANLSMVDLSDAELGNVSFVDADMRKANLSHMKCEYCDFSNVFLDDAVLKNASFVRSNFRGCHVSASQLEEAADLSGSTLPNGTVVKI